MKWRRRWHRRRARAVKPEQKRPACDKCDDTGYRSYGAPCPWCERGQAIKQGRAPYPSRRAPDHRTSRVVGRTSRCVKLG